MAGVTPEAYRQAQRLISSALGLGYPSPLRAERPDEEGQPGTLVAPLPLAVRPEQAPAIEAYLLSRLGGAWTVDLDWLASRLHLERSDEFSPLPPRVVWDGAATGVWSRFYLGEGERGKAVWDLRRAPHALVLGTSGSGKSTALNLIARQALLSGWRVVAVDPKIVEFAWLRGLEHVGGVACELDVAAKMLGHLVTEMSARYVCMTDAGVTHFCDLAEPPAPVLVMVDEVAGLMTSIPGDPGNGHRKQCSAALLEVAERGRSAGVHLVAAAQRLDSTAGATIGRLKANLSARVVCGYADQLAWRIATSEAPYPLVWDSAPGRAHLWVHGDVERIQVAYAEAG